MCKCLYPVFLCCSVCNDMQNKGDNLTKLMCELELIIKILKGLHNLSDASSRRPISGIIQMAEKGTEMFS